VDLQVAALLAMDREHLAAEYEQVCNNHDMIADFRAKLLGFLPFVSGAGILVLLRTDFADAPVQVISYVAAFGFLVTLGLFFYDISGIANCNALIEYGARLEMAMKLRGLMKAAKTDRRIGQVLEGFNSRTLDTRQWEGRFSGRPPRPFGFIGAETAGCVVYTAVLLAWATLFTFGLGCAVSADSP
jgi:hypothetical protein